jgi:hypothetical protein
VASATNVLDDARLSIDPRTVLPSKDGLTVADVEKASMDFLIGGSEGGGSGGGGRRDRGDLLLAGVVPPLPASCLGGRLGRLSSVSSCAAL